MPLQAGLLRVRLQVCGKNTPDRGEGSGPSRDQFPPSVLRACSLLRAGGNNTPQPANFICCHFLIFSLSLSLKHNSAPHWLPTVHHCTPVKPRLVAVGSPRFQSCRRCLECFSLSLYFSSVMFWEQKIHQTSWFFSSSPCCMWAPTVSSWQRRGESESKKTKARRQAAFEGC